MFCLRCGAIVPEGSDFCPSCGLKVGDLPETPKPQPVHPQYVPPQPQPVPPQQPQYAPPTPQQAPPQYAQAPPQYTQAPPVRPVAPPPPQYAPPQPQYVPVQPQPAPIPTPQPQPRYVQPQYSPRIVPQGPKARGRILLLITSIALALIALISMILQIAYYVGGSWIAFPSVNFLSGLQLLQEYIRYEYTWTIPFFVASIIVLGISIAGMPAAFSKKSGGFFIVTGIIFAVGQTIGFLAPLITNTMLYRIPLQEALRWTFAPTNIILAIIEIGLPILYIVGGILNKKTQR